MNSTQLTVVGASLLAAGAHFAADAHAQGVSDFNDGLGAGWTHYDPLHDAGVANPGSFSFSDGNLRIVPSRPRVSHLGPPRGAVIRTDINFADFYLAVDIVDWDDEINQSFGILARVENPGLGSLTGYSCNYNPNQNELGSVNGQFQISEVTGEQGSALAFAIVNLEAGRSYRMVFVGRGSQLTGALYDLGDLTAPVSMITTEQGDAYSRGTAGIYNFFRGDPSDAGSHIPDVTFDNFVALEQNPHADLWPAVAHGVEGIAQVVAREPQTNANFHDATKGITFSASTLTEAAVDRDSIQLVLNGEDVSENLEISGPANVLAIRYSELEPNRLYRAKIGLKNEHSAGTTNEWVFDTFQENLFESGTITVIEAEDYNYDGGRFEPNRDHIAGGYRDFSGEPGIDYFDFATSPAGANDYRPGDLAAMRARWPVAWVGLPPMGGDPTDIEVPIDNRRRKFVEADAPDYHVHETEGGEWLNYTRNFKPGSFRVYLRASSRAAQEVVLHEVTSNPSEPNQETRELGVFDVPNTIGHRNHQYIPLTNSDGNPITVEFAGARTLRLHIGGELREFRTGFTLYMNYLMLVPTELPGTATLDRNAVTSIKHNASSLSLTWESVNGQSYAIEYNEDLAGAWRVIGNAVARGNSTTFHHGDAEQLGNAQGYYRVIQTAQ